MRETGVFKQVPLVAMDGTERFIKRHLDVSEILVRLSDDDESTDGLTIGASGFSVLLSMVGKSHIIATELNE